MDDAVGFVLGKVREPLPAAQRDQLGLAAIDGLLRHLGQPDARLRCVHIAGSKGKGSTALMVDAIARRAGERTGLFTSPHLERWNERIRINGAPVEDAAFVEAIAAVAVADAELAKEHPELPVSFFDVLTAAALWRFAHDGVTFAVLETGLGGRLDATNIVTPVATAITSIELEHVDKLGDTLAAIAREKAGIIKRGVPLALGALPREAVDVVMPRASRAGARVLRLGDDAIASVREAAPGRLRIALTLRQDGRPTLELETELPTGARVMAGNAGVAALLAQAAGLLDEDGAHLLREGLQSCTLPGRCELMQQRPAVVVDAAHTPVAIEQLASSLLPHCTGKLHLVTSLSRSRDVGLLAPLASRATHIVACRADADRSADEVSLARALTERYPNAWVDTADSAAAALARALDGAEPDDMIVATGSVYLAGGVTGSLR